VTEALVDERGVVRVLHRQTGPRGDRAIRAVDGVDLVIERAGAHGLVGESGSGKSTLWQTLAGLQPFDAGAVTIDGVDVASSSRSDRRRMRRLVQPIFQDPYGSLDPSFTAARIIAEPLDALRIGTKAERSDRVDELLVQVGLDVSARRRRPHQFSGGQRQRLAIARALAPRPQLIVCDEATTALDATIQAQILRLLRDVRAETGTALLVIAHDLGVVRSVTDRVAVMYLGRIIEQGPTDAVFERPQHPYTQALVSALPRLAGRTRERIALRGEPGRVRGDGCRFAPRCVHVESRCLESQPSLRETMLGVSVACHLVGDTRSSVQ
jgi:oligopeptide/dipeptide ABC transporter ATP-binding protein